MGFVKPTYSDQIDPLERQLKGALLEEQKKLGIVDPWQKALYVNDVLPQYQKFIKDYTRSIPSDTGGMKVVVDEESLKRFLLFYGPHFLKKKGPRVLILLRPQPSCQKCVESLTVISELVQAQMWRRGLTPNLVSLDDLKLPATEVEVQDQVLAFTQQKGADATFVVQWGPAPVDDIDTAHVDDLRFVLRTFLKVGNFGSVFKQRELLANDSFLVAATSLLVDLFTDLGTTLEKEQLKIDSSGKAEVLIEVSGIQTFAQYMRVKSQIQVLLNEGSTIEERKLAPGQASFAVYTARSLEEVKHLFLNAQLDPGHNEKLNVGVSQ
jgi:hypothetical protein